MSPTVENYYIILNNKTLGHTRSLTHPYRFLTNIFSYRLHSLTKPKYYSVFSVLLLPVYISAPLLFVYHPPEVQISFTPQKLISFCTEGNPFNIFSFYMKKVRWLERPHDYTKLYIIPNGFQNLVLSSSCFSSTLPPHPPCSQIRPVSLSTHPVLAASVRVR